MKKFVVLLLVSLMATASFAALDEDNDSFGVYFSTTAMTVSRTTPIGTTAANVYILLINPTTAVAGFELAYRIDGWMEGVEIDPETEEEIPQGFVRTLQTIAGGSNIDLGNSQNAAAGSYAIGYAVARPATPIMLMVSWKIMNAGLMGVDPGLKFFLTGLLSNPSPGANGWPMINSGAAENALRQAGTASGSLTLPCAETNTNANGVGVVAEEVSSFGSVKSLFR